MSIRHPSEFDLWVWTGLLAITLATLHLMTPPGVNFEVLYIGLVFMSLWSSRRSYTYFVAALCTCLVMRVPFMKFIAGDIVGVELCNSILTSTMIWAAAFLCVLRQHTIAIESRLEGERRTAILRNEQLEEAAPRTSSKERTTRRHPRRHRLHACQGRRIARRRHRPASGTNSARIPCSWPTSCKNTAPSAT